MFIHSVTLRYRGFADSFIKYLSYVAIFVRDSLLPKAENAKGFPITSHILGQPNRNMVEETTFAQKSSQVYGSQVQK